MSASWDHIARKAISRGDRPLVGVIYGTGMTKPQRRQETCLFLVVFFFDSFVEFPFHIYYAVAIAFLFVHRRYGVPHHLTIAQFGIVADELIWDHGLMNNRPINQILETSVPYSIN